MKRVNTYKLLGVIISDDLSLGGSKKAFKRLYSFRILKRVTVASDSILRMYNLTIRPILEYGVLVWPVDIPEFLSRKLESIQKRALCIIIHHLVTITNLAVQSLVAWQTGGCNFAGIIFSRSHKIGTQFIVQPPRMIRELWVDIIWELLPRVR